MKALSERRVIQTRRLRRSRHVRKRIHGTGERPRLAVHRSLQNISAQVIDDDQGRTLVHASTLEKDLRAQLQGKGGNVEAAKLVGQRIAERLKESGVTKVCFDRRHYKYHGRVAALADAAREAGLQF